MKIIPLLIRKVLFSLALMFTATGSHAGIIDFGSYFTDTDSGLNWLDVTATVNRSYSDINSQLGSGGEFDGWRYATGAEFNSILFRITNVPVAASGRTITTGTSPSVDGLVELFGSTLDSRWLALFGQTWDNQNGYSEGQGLDFTLGILADTFETDANQRKVASIWDNEGLGAALDFYNIDHRQVFLGDQMADIGSFLVRGASSNAGNTSGSGNNNGSNVVAVSEPTNTLLFMLGLIGLSLCRRKN